MYEIDRAIIKRLQHGFPICASPYRQVAEQLGISETDLLNRLQNLLIEGVLSRFGPIYHTEQEGGGSTLAAMKVPEERFDEVSTIVNAFPEVTHVYVRNHSLNMWFTLTTERPEQVQAVIQSIEQQTGMVVHSMPKIEELLSGATVGGVMQLDAIDRQIIKATQAGLPLLAEPYQALADLLGVSTEDVMQRMNKMQENGVIRRIIGEVANHYKLSYLYNGTTAWGIDDQHVDDLERVAEQSATSHAYHHPQYLPDLPYNLFAMMYGKADQGPEKSITGLLGEDSCEQHSDADYQARRLDKAKELIKEKVSLSSSAPSLAHQRISTRLTGILYAYFKKKPCQLFAAPFEVRLYDRRKSAAANSEAHVVVQPDLCVICDSEKLDQRGCLGAPDWIIEILSQGGSKQEMQIKYRLYRESGVKEYWIIYPFEQAVHQFVLNEAADKYDLLSMFSGEDSATPRLFPELVIDLREVFAE